MFLLRIVEKRKVKLNQNRPQNILISVSAAVIIFAYILEKWYFHDLLVDSSGRNESCDLQIKSSELPIKYRKHFGKVPVSVEGKSKFQSTKPSNQIPNKSSKGL